jgi:hypothetical protein
MKSRLRKRCGCKRSRHCDRGDRRVLWRRPPARKRCAPALAIGADRAILVETDVELQPLAVAKLLKAVADKEGSLGFASSASRPSMTTATRPARCWRPCWAGRRPLFASKLKVEGDKLPAWFAKWMVVWRPLTLKMPIGDHHGPASERAALRDAAEHHEGQEEAPRGDQARCAGCRCHAASGHAESGPSRPSARPASRSRTCRLLWTSLRTKQR